MLPKAVLSWVGRLVGIAAVMASPLVARAAEVSDTESPKGAHQASSTTHAHATKSSKAKLSKTKKSHRATKAEARASRSAVTTPAAAPKDDGRDEARSDKAALGSPEIIAEHASTRSVPKPSKTPLPTVAAAAVRPLLLAASVKDRDCVPVTHAERASMKKSFDKGHAIEPRTTPILRASTLPEHEHATEHASEHSKAKTSKTKPPCLHASIEVTRGSENESFPLTKCDGSVLPSAVDEMSVLVRPGNTARPAAATSEGKDAKASESASAKGEIAPGIKRIDARLVERIQLMVDHFAKPGTTPQLFVVSGYRPSSKGSFHAMGRAIDFRLEGTENTDLVAFCKTLDDTGCGFYPNSSFIHVDVRDPGAGHVAWIDASGPGEKPDYLASWPPAPKEEEADPVKLLARLDELAFLPKEEASEKKPLDESPADPKPEATKKPACAAGEEDAPAAATEKSRDEN